MTAGNETQQITMDSLIYGKRHNGRTGRRSDERKGEVKIDAGGIYKDALSTLKNGEKYLLDVIREYPVGKTEDGIQPIIYVKSRIKSPESMMRKLWKRDGKQTQIQH